MKVAIIGGGAAGLAAIKQCLDENLECIAFEQGNKIGGTWNYYEKLVDGDVLSFHSSMYHGLRTNLPKELMELDGLPHKENQKSFISQPEVLQYLEDYTERFGLYPYIKFDHKVDLMDPLPDSKWLIQVRDLKKGAASTYTFDAVIVCNGHFSNPFYPSIKGMEHFNERSLHSHYFRKPDKYTGKKVLVIGGGPSGIDIARMVGQVADKVYFSFRKKELIFKLPEKAVVKPGISHFSENSVNFVDGTVEEIDEVIYCTGFITTFPFLSKSCELTVDENWVYPLYKHTINIEHPTMAVISILVNICPFPLFGLQIRFFLAYLQDKFKVSKQEMFEDLQEDLKKRDEMGLTKRSRHVLGPAQLEYCEELANLADIRGLPRVVGVMFKYINMNSIKTGNYKVINDNEFVFIPI